MNDSKVNKKDKNQHIQVFVRVRPPNTAEKVGKSLTVIEVPSNKDLIVRERPQDKLSKKFTFDKVFGPASKQVDVYKAVVSPLLDEVLAGYNCTVFAYGQTGTGKTFTMEGVTNDPALHWQSDTSAGIIPRSLSQLFDELRILDAQEYSVRVSFLELYNEELFDLLSPNDDASKIRLYEDASKKGAIIIHGLEEVTVHDKIEVYKILEKGSEKRQTAATLMNAQSSRSHTVFSITVHIKENTVDGEELLKTGKLNLVDLAGSENVGRSGAVDRRAREAGNINQSLLTLGRVITALVERAPHIPYRESKLTRLLQESLGGRTKTSIIATISPAIMNLEETLSTLDYAYRAKHITNRPEINQKLSKKALLKEYTEEIERLRRDLLATRERNGVYLAQENYNEIQSLLDHQGREIQIKINHIKALEEHMLKREEVFNELQTIHTKQAKALYKTLESTKNTLKSTELDRDIHKHLVEKHVNTETVLRNQAQTLLVVADSASTDTYKLHDKIRRKKQVEEENENLGHQFKEHITQRFVNIEKDLSVYTQDLVQFFLSMKDKIGASMDTQINGIDTVIRHASSDLVNQESAISNNLVRNVNKSFECYQLWVDKQIQEVVAISKSECYALNKLSAMLAPKLYELVQNKIAENLYELNEGITKRIEEISSYVKQSGDRVCDNLLADRDRLWQAVSDIKGIVETSTQKQNEMLQNRQNFVKAFDELYLHFNTLCKKEEDAQSAICTSYTQLNDICETVSNTSKVNYEQSIASHKNFEENVFKHVTSLKEEITSSAEKNRELSRDTIERSKLVNELQTGLSESCNGWSKYKTLLERNANELKLKMAGDQNAIVSSAREIHQIVADYSVNHDEYMEDQRSKLQNLNSDVTRKLETQGVESLEWNNKITSTLRTTQHEVDKFLIEDLRRDVPTGNTPARKDFHYPRKLVATSPHERIIQRFRETRETVEMSEMEDETLPNADDTLKPDTPSMEINTLDHSTFPTGMTIMRSTSTPSNVVQKKLLGDDDNRNDRLIRSASASDISVLSSPMCDHILHSESDTCLWSANKENGQGEFPKPEKTVNTKPVTSIPKLKPSNRRVLGTFN
ncbi:kinesin-like protein Klp61F [Orussus abietinus]|uniref:kinesin-like protein Klp61F n=1 Tax=Orussus abietinus TaxID=222816 RepID=UPI0006259C94|nr:kinesin-like protein Klp61F [Orussus abietinus]